MPTLSFNFFRQCKLITISGQKNQTTPSRALLQPNINLLLTDCCVRRVAFVARCRSEIFLFQAEVRWRFIIRTRGELFGEIFELY